MAEKVRSGLDLRRIFYWGRRVVFAGDFAIFWCFVKVKTWLICGGMRGKRGVLYGAFGLLKTRQLFRLYFS
jgi:hypothetical protein